MAFDAFNLEAKISVKGISKALRGLSDLQDKAKDLANDLDNLGKGLDLNSIGRQINQAAKSAEKSLHNASVSAKSFSEAFENTSHADEMERSFRSLERRSQAFADNVLNGFRAMGKDSLKTSRDFDKLAKQIERFGTTTQRVQNRLNQESAANQSAYFDLLDDYHSRRNDLIDATVKNAKRLSKIEKQSAKADTKATNQKVKNLKKVEKAQKELPRLADIERSKQLAIPEGYVEKTRYEKIREKRESDALRRQEALKQLNAQREARLLKESQEAKKQVATNYSLETAATRAGQAAAKRKKKEQEQAEKEAEKAKLIQKREFLAEQKVQYQNDPRNALAQRELENRRKSRLITEARNQGMLISESRGYSKPIGPDLSPERQKEADIERSMRRILDRERQQEVDRQARVKVYGYDPHQYDKPIGPKKPPKNPPNPPNPPDNPPDNGFFNKKTLKEINSGWTTLKGTIASTIGNLSANVIQEFFQSFINGVRQAIDYTIELNQATNNLNSLFDMTPDKLSNISKKLITSFERTGVGANPIQLTNVMRDIGALGINDPDLALAITEQTAKFAKAGFTDIDTGGQVLAGAMAAWGAGAEEATKYSDALIASADLGRVTLKDYAVSLGRAAPAAVQAGLSIEEFVTLVGVSTQGLLRGETAITGWGEVLEKFAGANRTKKAVEILEKYNYQLDTMALKAKGPIKIISELQQKIEEFGDDPNVVWAELAGSRSGNRAIQAALDTSGGVSRLEAGFEEVLKGGQTDQRLQEIMKGAMEQWDLFKSQMYKAVSEFADVIGPAFAKLLNRLNTELKPEVESIFATVSATAETFGRLFDSGNKDTLKNTLISIAQGIKDVTIFMVDLKAALSAVINVARLFINTMQMGVKFVYAIGQMLVGYFMEMKTVIGHLSRGEFSKAKQAYDNLTFDSKAFDGFNKTMMSIYEDTQEFSQAFVNLMDVKDTWEKDTAMAEDVYKKHIANLTGIQKDFDPAAPVSKAAQKQTKLQEEHPYVAAPTAPNKAPANPFVGMDSKDLAFLGEKYRLLDDTSRNRLDPQGLMAKVGFDPMSAAGYLESELANDVLMDRKKLHGGELGQLREAINPPVSSAASPISLEQAFQASGANMASLPETATAPKPPKPKEIVRNVDAEFDSIKHQADIEKISKKEAITKWESLLRYAQKTNVEIKKQRKIEKEIYDLKKAQAKENERLAKERKKQRDDARVEHIRNTQGARAGDIAKLELDIERKRNAGVPEDEINAWAKSERTRITNKHNEAKEKKDEAKRNKEINAKVKNLKFQAELAGAENDPLKEQMLLLDAEIAEYEKHEKDKTKIAQLYEAKRLQIQKDFAMEQDQIRQDLLSRIAANEAELLRAKDKNDKAELIEHKAANAERYLEIKKQVEEWRKARMSEVDIERFINSEVLRIMQDAKNKKKQIEKEDEQDNLPENAVTDNPADPRRLAGQSDGSGKGFSLGTFSINATGKRKIKRTNHTWSEDAALAAKVAALAKVTGKKPDDPSSPAGQSDGSGKGLSPFSTDATGERKTDEDAALADKFKKSYWLRRNKAAGIQDISGVMGNSSGQASSNAVEEPKGNHDTLTVVVQQATAAGVKSAGKAVYKKGSGSNTSNDVQLGRF